MVLAESIPEHPEDYYKKLNWLQQQQKDALNEDQPDADRYAHTQFYENTIYDIVDMAKGGNAGGVRVKYYPDWTDDDFRDLLDELGELGRLE